MIAFGKLTKLSCPVLLVSLQTLASLARLDASTAQPSARIAGIVKDPPLDRPFVPASLSARNRTLPQPKPEHSCRSCTPPHAAKNHVRLHARPRDVAH